MRRVRSLFGRRIGLALVCLIGVMTALAVGHRPGPGNLPDPNGFDNLVRAARSIQGPWPNKGDWARADPTELRAFVVSNRPALDGARRGLGRPGIAHFADSPAGIADHLEQSGQMRDLSRLLAAEARVALEERRPLDAALINLEVIEVAQTLTQGAAFAGATAGWVIQDQAMGRLRTLGDQIPSTALPGLIRRLERLDARRVAVQQVEQREDRLFAGATPIYLRVQFQLTGMRAAALAPVRKSNRQIHDRVERSCRYLLVQWAIHLHHETTGRWPRSVAELVPSILPAVPIDPNTNQPLIYPSNAAGELTDDLSQIGVFPTASTPP